MMTSSAGWPSTPTQTNSTGKANAADLKSTPTPTSATPIGKIGLTPINSVNGSATKPGVTAIAVGPGGTKLLPRVDVEQIYISLRETLGDNWAVYSDAIRNFFRGLTNRAELSQQLDSLLSKPEAQRLHNQYFWAVHVNATRELPETEVATWVSHQGKVSSIPKPVTGDAHERKLKKEVMSLPARDRRRMKEIPDVLEDLNNLLLRAYTSRQLKHKVDNVPQSAGLNKNWQNELTTAYSNPLASESGEYMDNESILARCVPICYETGLGSSIADDTAKFIGLATDMFVREVLCTMFARIGVGVDGDGETVAVDIDRVGRTTMAAMAAAGIGAGGGGSRALKDVNPNSIVNGTSTRNTHVNGTHTTNNIENFNKIADRRGGTVNLEHLRLSVGFSDNLVRQMPLAVYTLLGGVNAYDRFEELDDDYWEEDEDVRRKRVKLESTKSMITKLESTSKATAVNGVISGDAMDEGGGGTMEMWDNPASAFLMECLSGV